MAKQTGMEPSTLAFTVAALVKGTLEQMGLTKEDPSPKKSHSPEHLSLPPQSYQGNSSRKGSVLEAEFSPILECLLPLEEENQESSQVCFFCYYD